MQGNSCLTNLLDYLFVRKELIRASVVWGQSLLKKVKSVKLILIGFTDLHDWNISFSKRATLIKKILLYTEKDFCEFFL